MKNKIIGTLFWVLILTAWSCSNKMEEINAFSNSDKDLPMLTVHGLKSEYSTLGNVNMQLISSILHRYSDEKRSFIAFPQGCKINLYNDDSEVESSVKADSAIYYEKTQDAKASGNVTVTNSDGSILRSEELFLRSSTKKIYSLKPVTITYANGSVIHGDGGFESNFNFTVYRFKDVKGIQNITEKFDVRGE